MNILKKMEIKYGKYAIKNLNFYLTVIFAIGLVIQIFDRQFYQQFLVLDINKFMHGQIWRVFTFLFYPPGGSSLIFALISLYVYYSLTKMLLLSMSDFKFNLFILNGVLLQLIGGILFKVLSGINIAIYPSYFIFSILLAFCFTYSDAMMLFYFIIPVKAKYIGYIELFFFLSYFISGTIADRIVIIATLLNVFIYIYLLRHNKL